MPAELVAALVGAGFADDAEAKATAEANAAAQGLSDNGGDYTVLHVLTKGDVIVTIEQNDAPEDVGGLSAVVKHPPLAVVASPKGRVAFNPDDAELGLALVDELS